MRGGDYGDRPHEPSPASRFYDEMYPLYRALYPALRPTLNAVAGLVA